MQTKKAFNKQGLLRGTLPIVVSVGLLWVFGGGLLTVDTEAIFQAVQKFKFESWALATALTVLSFAAVAQYDRIIAGWLELDVPKKAMLHAGWRATAISQVLGYGLITGALIRWRALGGMGLCLWDCSRVTFFASVAFFIGWSVVTTFALSLSGKTAAVQLPSVAIWGVALVAILLGALCLRPPKLLFAWLPGLSSYLGVIVFTALDTMMAAAVIFVFLPDGYTTFLPFYAMFLVAFSAGMLSGLPAGLGAFEVTLIALLAPSDPAPLLSAILAYRLIYFAAPAIVAALSLVRTPVQKRDDTAIETSIMVPPALALHAPPEADLTIEGQLKVACPPGVPELGALTHRARHADILLGDPFGPEDVCIHPFLSAARRANRPLLLYKIGAHIAELTARSGFVTLCIGSEAIVRPHAFTTTGSAFRQLRRKLTRADKAGVTVTDVPPDYTTLAALDRAWQNNNGRARGFSMGRLSPNLINRQRVFTAEREGKPVAFITLLIGADRWTLDLIRAGDDMPDGSMHALVAAAIHEAKKENVPEISLAAAPMRLPAPPRSWSEHMVDYIYQKSPQLKGLAQFKTCFNPQWEPRFLAVERTWALPLALFDLWVLINRPSASPSTPNTIHNHYALYEIDSRLTPCHALERMTERDPFDDAA